MNIKREHVEQACSDLLRSGAALGSATYMVRFGNSDLPAKRVIREAYRLANGFEIHARAFSGGVFTERILVRLGVAVTRSAKT